MFNLILIFFSEIVLTYSLITQEKIQFLKSKITKKFDVKHMDDIDKLKIINSELSHQKIKYVPEKIAKIIEELEVPETYNFFNSSGCEIVIKDQRSCGCCWSMAATTSLAYRYFKYGITIDLSPQDGLSCYVKDCDMGNYLIDSAMNLVKNGTVTEGCLPFSSGDGRTIEECPTTCKDGSEYKKYYAKEIYSTEGYYSEENFYDFITIMIYQLVNYGPISCSIDIYEDFIEWSDYEYKERCKNQVYSYDGISEFLGGHAVTITGYGKIGSKYYWLIQNSWGKETCDEGFIKIEMGQIGVENFAVEEPYFPIDSQKIIDIDVKPNLIDRDCTLTVNSQNLPKEWTDVLELSFKNQNSRLKRTFNFQCSKVDLPKGYETNCYYEWFNWIFMDKGEYVFSSSKALGVNNYFNLDEKFYNMKFNFYGGNFIYYAFSQLLFISGEGSSISLYHDYSYGIESNLPPIYPNKNSIIPLRDCQPFNYSDLTFVQCILHKEEIDYFESFEKITHSPLVYSYLCGWKESAEVYVMKINQTQFPILYAKKLYAPKSGVIDEESILDLYLDNQGYPLDISFNSFFVFVYRELNGQNYTSILGCLEETTQTNQKEIIMSCFPSFEPGEEYWEFESLYLSKIYLPYDIFTPYDLIIPEIIKAEKQ